jgi:hypothetical protein
VTEAIRHLIEDDRFPHAPRLDPLRSALAKFEAQKATPPERPETDHPLLNPASWARHRWKSQNAFVCSIVHQQ